MKNRAELRRQDRRRVTRRRVLGGLTAGLALTGAAVFTQLPLSSAGAATDWPTSKGDRSVPETIEVKGTFDGEYRRFKATSALGDGSQKEGQKPVFKLADGAVLKNVVLGAPAADGVHCMGSCTIQNVWWEDVGEDAATFRGGDDAVYTVRGGGAKHAADKVFQHNGGGKLVVSKFTVEDFTTLYRSCGNCSTQKKRTAIFRDIEVKAPGLRMAGINSNYGDSVALREITVIGDTKNRLVPCQKYKGNNTGSEPERLGTDADGKHCNYRPSDITYR
ncbi:pectate lyase [Streptomyces sp. 549]|uniref:pectate lyase n=1 Tax=Streptomyces sp. 549 TaxID=3049076 RepID=UPI0024C4506B|nr:pectate lyase [Streptomyces sp. 549]MDK1472426.1 pectate lyase [Streptomyces sp. 549]